MGKHYINEIGTEILLDVGVDITDAGFAHVTYKKPDGTTTGTWVGAIYSSYSEEAQAIGYYFIKYTLLSGDLDQSGEWKFQAFLATTSGIQGTWYGETASETIFAQFN